MRSATQGDYSQPRHDLLRKRSWGGQVLTRQKGAERAVEGEAASFTPFPATIPLHFPSQHQERRGWGAERGARGAGGADAGAGAQEAVKEEGEEEKEETGQCWRRGGTWRERSVGGRQIASEPLVGRGPIRPYPTAPGICHLHSPVHLSLLFFLPSAEAARPRSRGA